MSFKKKIFLSGGGTGGHIWPLISIAKKLKDEYKIYFVGQANSEEEQIARKFKIDFLPVKTGKLQGLSKINPITYFKQLIGIFQSIRYINKYQPKLIFSKGGYVSFPVAVAGYLKGVRLVIHESDSVVGRTNRILSRLAFRFLTGFPVEYYSSFFQHKMIEVGIPTREEFKETDLPHRKQVLFMGGSQGSSFINNLVIKNAHKIASDIDIVHICGDKNYQKMKKEYQKLDDNIKKRYQLISFTNDIARLMQKSTIVVSRSGATSIVEIAKVKRPVILIPFPYATADHQLKNAQIIESKKAGILIKEAELKNRGYEILVKELNSLLNDYRKRVELAENLNKFMSDDANERIAKIIRSII